MKPFPIFIMLLIMSSLVVTGQTNRADPAFDNTSGILFPDGEFEKIDGRMAGKYSSHRYTLARPIALPDGSKSNKTQIIRKERTAIFIERKVTELKSTASLNTADRFYAFMEAVKSQTKIITPKEAFRITGIHMDKIGTTHIRAIQQYKGIDIYGSESILHVDHEKERFTGKFFHPDETIPARPVLDSNQALAIMKEDLSRITTYRELTQAEKKLLEYESPSSSLVVFNKGKDEYTLVWSISVRPNLMEEWKYFVDALNGEIIRKYNNTQSDGTVTAYGTDLNGMMRTFNVYLTAGIYYMYDISQSMFNPVTNEGIIVTLDANNTSALNLDYNYVTSVDNQWTQQGAISAHCNAAKTYEYFYTTFNRNSINGKGGNIISLVNIVNEDGSPMENAFWNGQAVFYGKGGENFNSIAGALDVTAHELSHGVISSTANLEYYGQSGAINESFADIFACMVDRFDWTIGEDITRETYSPSGVIRDLSNPNNMGDSTLPYWQPAHTSQMYLGADDNGGIHLNSGICNYAYFLFAEKIGKNKAEQVFYRALTEYLTKTSGFIDLRIAVTQSARDLYGDGSIEVYEAGRAFETVGIYEEESVDDFPDYDPNPGVKLLLTYDTNPNDPVSLYVSTSEGTNYRPLSNTAMKGKLSVTDDGSTGVFVSSERRLRMINTTGVDVNERIISGYSFYDNVAISKDGKRLAATKGFQDGSIYMIDLVSGEGRQFLLYNPTTSTSGIDAGGVLKAYSLEFDITGEYLIYDAYNVINSNSLKDIYYWDIGFIKVWDNKEDFFGNGVISKLFTTLPAHVNVTNPVFSKNNPNIIAFDYFYDDGIIEEYGIYASNIETGEINQISVNDRLGYPTFSTFDDKIAYSTINGLNRQVVKAVKLKEDKISPEGEAGVLVPDAKWPVFFTSGIRSLGLAPVSNYTADFKYGHFPLTTRFIDLSSYKPESWSWIFEGGVPAVSNEQNPVVTFEMPGFYKVTLITANSYGKDTLTRENYIHAIDPVSTDDGEKESILFYPNPVKDVLHIICDQDFVIKILNMQGDVMNTVINSPLWDASHLKPGVYILELATKKSSYRYKLMKQ